MARPHLSRLLTFGPAAVIPAGTWLYLREPVSKPLDWVVLTAVMLAGLVVIPVLLLTVLLLPRMPVSALAPRRWRKRYRRWRKNTRIRWLREDREHQHSSYIPGWLHALVLAADRHRCVACRSRLMLQADHVYPWSQGGLTILLNLMTLCRDCNVRIKSNYWPGVHYMGAASPAEAGRVLKRELRHRLNPLRLTRAAWALGA